MTPRIHVVVPTHTTRHLRACVLAALIQTRPPDTLVVSTDGDDPALAQTVEDAVRTAREHGNPANTHVLFTSRAHTGEARLNQVRNNALRALRPHAADRDPVVVIDGDIVLAPDAIGRHLALLARTHALVVPFRVDLDPLRTAQIDEEYLRDPEYHVFTQLLRDRDRAALDRRHRRYVRQARMRAIVGGRFGLPKSHKPKILGGHHAVRWDALDRVNGYDERYVGYGLDDDDLSRRLYAAGYAPAIAVSGILALHLHHPTRAPARPEQMDGWSLFNAWDGAVRAPVGLDDPAAQPSQTIKTL